MPTYEVIQFAKIWKDFERGELSRQIGALSIGDEVQASFAGRQNESNHVIVKLAEGGFTKAMWLRVVLDPIPDPDPDTDPDLPPTTDPVPEPLPEGLWIVRGDEELAEFGYKSRTADPLWSYARQTPSVFRFAPEPVRNPLDGKAGEYRVDITRQDREIRRLNAYDSDFNRIVYLYSSGTALFNRTGFPRLQYLTMSFNLLRGLAVENGCLKFETLKPALSTNGMSHASHPWFVHKWDIVTMRNGATVHVNTPHGDVFWFLTTAEGCGFIPLRFVRPYAYGEE